MVRSPAVKKQHDTVSEDIGGDTTVTGTMNASRNRWHPGVSNNDNDDHKETLSISSPKGQEGRYREMISSEPPMIGARTPKVHMYGATSNPAF